MAYSSPPTKLTTDSISGSDWNTYVKGNLDEIESRKDQSRVVATANVATATTVEASATTIVTAGAITANGVDQYEVEFYCPKVDLVGNAAGNAVIISLFDGANQVARIGHIARSDAGTDTRSWPVDIKYPFPTVPTNGAHTYSIRAHHTVAACTFNAGLSGVGVIGPMFIRVRKVQ